jgi:hypothetical protein
LILSCSGLRWASVACTCSSLGVEAALERWLGKDVKLTELAHVDMKARLQQAGLEHVADLPQLWPPSLAVGLQ